MAKSKLDVHGTQVKMLHINNTDYISITDIAKIRNPIEPKDVVKNWMRSKNAVMFLGLWEKLNNPTPLCTKPAPTLLR